MRAARSWGAWTGDTFPEAARSLGVQRAAGVLGPAQSGQGAERQAAPIAKGSYQLARGRVLCLTG